MLCSAEHVGRPFQQIPAFGRYTGVIETRHFENAAQGKRWYRWPKRLQRDCTGKQPIQTSDEYHNDENNRSSTQADPRTTILFPDWGHSALQTVELLLRYFKESLQASRQKFYGVFVDVSWQRGQGHTARKTQGLGAYWTFVRYSMKTRRVFLQSHVKFVHIHILHVRGINVETPAIILERGVYSKIVSDVV